MTQRERAAYHEAGHAVISYRFCSYAESVSIDREGNGFMAKTGRLRALEVDSRVAASLPALKRSFEERVYAYCLVNLAGPIAEQIAAGERMPRGQLFLRGTSSAPGSDWGDLTRALALIGGGEFFHVQVWLLPKVRRMLREHKTWSAVQDVAASLASDGHIDGGALIELLDARGLSRRVPGALYAQPSRLEQNSRIRRGEA